MSYLLTIKKWGETLEYVSCFSPHFFRALAASSYFTTEQSTVKASLFDNQQVESRDKSVLAI